MTTPHTTTARKPSRFVRPERLPPLWLQRRDREILLSVFQHRYLSALHIRALHFPGVSLRQAQYRLRKLWAHKFLDRHFVPFVWTGETVPAALRRPYYCLARRGAEVVSAAQGDLDLSLIPHTPRANAQGFATFQHNLVVTDLLVALQAAVRCREDVVLAGIEREVELQRKLRLRLMEGWRGGSALVPDGVFTLSCPDGRRQTFYIEVVRAGAKGGNKNIGARFRRYAEAHHRGVFRELYGHEQLRAVLVLTTDEARSDRFRTLAAGLPHGRRLFWFGVFEEPGGEMCFQPESILAQEWQTTEGETISFLSLGAGPTRPGAA